MGIDFTKTTNLEKSEWMLLSTKNLLLNQLLILGVERMISQGKIVLIICTKRECDLLKKGVPWNLQKLPKVEKKSEEDELTFMPKTNWRKSRRSYPRPKGGRTGTFESLVNETMDDMNIGKVPRKMNRDSEEDVEKAFDQKLNDFKKEIEEMGQDDDALSEANQPSVSHPGSVVSEPPLSYY